MLAGVLAAIVLLLAGIWLGGHPSDLPAPLRSGIFGTRQSQIVTQQALDILTSRYYRPLNRSKLVDLSLSGMVAGLDDRYSHYIDPSAYKESMNESDTHTVGIGINFMDEPEGLRIVNVVEDSPAARAGLQRGDLIVRVGSVSLLDRGDQSVSELLTGPAGTTVVLTVRRGQAEHVVSVTREEFAVPVATSRMLSYNGVRIGYLRLTAFSEDSGDELRAEVEAVLHKHAQALILDLRGNGGGLIDQAINVASIFLAHGEIMSAVERGQPTRVYDARGNAIAPQTPLVVLVDHGTASSSEIVTAALQDQHRAEVVGTPTYGKGVFQNTLPLINGGALDITIGQFFTPSGRNLGDGVHPGAGITPNVYAPDASRYPTDEQLAAAERTVAAEVR
ncbi:MAG TPA: S41 family peptidase [Solirubrobacteraceae bacterium]|nr:S41 family peptidase [Solirubrobacteraceae bacterium]